MTTATIPTYGYKLAPAGLLTKRQLRARGLRPGGQDPAGQIVWRRGRRFALLYRLDLAKPVRPMSPAMWRSHVAMMRARRTCPVCMVTYAYVIPRSLGECVACADRRTLSTGPAGDAVSASGPDLIAGGPARSAQPEPARAA